MSVVKLIDDYLLEFGNERFLEGWNGQQDRIIKLLEEHAWQLEVKHRILGFKWKQRCRCGFYGVFNKHLIALIKGEK